MNKRINLFGFDIFLEIIKKRKPKSPQNQAVALLSQSCKLNFGPGPNWQKPDPYWLSVDIDPRLGDIIVDFQSFEELPLKSESIHCVYGSHVFEHISIFKSQKIFTEIYRVLKSGAYFRLILPDAEKSLKEYVNGNHDFTLFKRRKERAKKNNNIDYTLFECMREDFISPSGQVGLLGQNTLAHQNAWDYETIKTDLIRAGFNESKIERMNFKQSNCDDFSFEGTYESEANENYRSLYIEVQK